MNAPAKESQIENELAEKIRPVFSIYDIQHAQGNIFFFGVPKEEIRIIFEKLFPFFSEKGYQFTIKYDLGEHILIASPLSPQKERRWINVVLAIATVFTTMVFGSLMFGADPGTSPAEVLKGLPFTIAIMTVLGAHEAGHYIVAKKHGMHTSLPYFIPFPNMIGTMGAVIKHKGPIPNRKALFDVGVSGPLIGLFVSIIVTIFGLLQPAIPQASEGLSIELGIPFLFELISRFIPNQETMMMHPIAFAGWVGMFVTALNLIPAGQLDGGHVLRAMIGERAKEVSRMMPFILISLGFYVIYYLEKDGYIWVLWGLFLSFFTAAGHPRPLDDDIPLGKGRMALGIITFILGLICFTLVPFQLQ
ncbi:MAG: site-2 protease family protein [Candidatus Methanoperedens sp.]|nr:site-2 protease family protein [Candidatus Methanoperedens sp.]